MKQVGLVAGGTGIMSWTSTAYDITRLVLLPSRFRSDQRGRRVRPRQEIGSRLALEQEESGRLPVAS
jgi:hypothetical protein